MSGAQADVMRKNRGPEHFRVAVDCIDPEQNRNGLMRATCVGQRGLVKLVGEIQPSLGGGTQIVAGGSVAARENRSQLVLAQIRGRYRGNVRLDHLANFLLEAQLRQQPFDEPLRINRRKRIVRSARPWVRLYTSAGGGAAVVEGRRESGAGEGARAGDCTY
jgi:hypothetical protein